MTGRVEFLLCERCIKVDTKDVQKVLANGAKHRIENCWLMLEGNFKFKCNVVTAMRPDVVVYSEWECTTMLND